MQDTVGTTAKGNAVKKTWVVEKDCTKTGAATVGCLEADPCPIDVAEAGRLGSCLRAEILFTGLSSLVSKSDIMILVNDGAGCFSKVSF